VAGWVPPMLPAEEPLTEGFFAGARRGELCVQACLACGRLRHPPRPMCPWCRSTDSTWRGVSGRGTIWSFAVPHPPLLAGFAELAPYNVIIVALDDDPLVRLTGNLVEAAGGPPNAVDPATLAIGEPVRVVFHLVEDVAYPQWVRA